MPSGDRRERLHCFDIYLSSRLALSSFATLPPQLFSAASLEVQICLDLSNLSPLPSLSVPCSFFLSFFLSLSLSLFLSLFLSLVLSLSNRSINRHYRRFQSVSRSLVPHLMQKKIEKLTFLFKSKINWFQHLTAIGLIISFAATATASQIV